MKAGNPIFYVLIFCFASTLFMHSLGKVHLFDWDEINFAESAREMLVTGNYARVQIDYQPFWEKPPLFFWMQAAAMNIFGVGEYAARLPNAICGVLTLLLIFYVGKRLDSVYLGGIWVLCYTGAFLPHFYFKSGIIDPIFNLFMFISLLCFALYFRQARLHLAIAAGLFTGLAVLTKGPVGLLVPALVVFLYVLYKKEWKKLLSWHVPVFLFLLITVSFLWYGVELMQNGFWFFEAFISYQLRLLGTEDSGHGGPFYYHLLVLLMGCFPVSLLLFQPKAQQYGRTEDARYFQLWMWLLLIVILLVFSLVRTKIVHYSSFAYFPITFLAAIVLRNLWANPAWKLKWWVKILLLLLGIPIGLSFALLPLAAQHHSLWVPHINDPFAAANLQAEVYWPFWWIIFGLFFLLALAVIFVPPVRRNVGQRFVFFLIINTLIIQALMTLYVPKIEGYSQRAAIEFYKTLQGKDVYVEVLGYKSYAHLFYSRKLPEQSVPPDERHSLLQGRIDKPAYFVTK
ncbi:MAG: glycosyltransferase family 39 protein, partial [Chitinophagales bacterium]